MIRARLSIKTDEDGTTSVKVEWVEVVASRVVDVKLVEEFKVGPDRQGCSYVSRVGFQQGDAERGTFWIDEQGNRHFVVDADPGLVGMIGGTS